MNIRLLLVAATAGALTLSACSSSGGGSAHNTGAAGSSRPAAGAPASSAAKITIKNFGFSGTLSVKAGEKVTVVNQDSVAHTLTDKKGGKFDTGTISPGGTGTFTAPDKAGTYPFGCTFHPDMAGTLTVTG